MVLERAGVPYRLCSASSVEFFSDSVTSVEHFGAARGQFAMMKGVRQGCPAGCYLFTMAFDPLFRWLMTDVLPREPHRPWFLQQTACGYADYFALAPASLRETLPTVAGAFATIDQVCRCTEIRPRPYWWDGSLPASLCFGKCRLTTMPKTWV